MDPQVFMVARSELQLIAHGDPARGYTPVAPAGPAGYVPAAPNAVACAAPRRANLTERADWRKTRVTSHGLRHWWTGSLENSMG
jgi:hypothetical protein